jgi:hypothetical protein
MSSDIHQRRGGLLREFSLRAFLALRWWVGLALIVAWNALMLLAIRLNGGWGAVETPGAMLVLALATLGLGTFCFAVAWSERVRDAVLAQRRRHYYRPEGFFTVGVIAFGMSLILLVLYFQIGG